MYSTEERELTRQEISDLKKRVRSSADEIVWLLVPTFILGCVGLFLGKLIEWVIHKFGADVSPWASYPLAGCLGCLGLSVNVRVSRRRRQYNASLRAEIQAGRAQVIHVTAARAARVYRRDDEMPIVLFDIGEGKLLFVIGQWMDDPHVFEPAGADARFPSGFPSESFALSRLPRSGIVLGVRVTGEPLDRLPRATLQETGLKKHPFEEFKESVILDGVLPPS